MNWRARRTWSLPGGLSSRIVLLSLVLLLVVQAAVFSVVRIAIEQSARRQVAQELRVGERVWLRLLEQNAQKLNQGATLLAADYGFRAAVGSADLDTIASALENHGARIGATATALLDTQFQLRAVAEGQDAAALHPVLASPLRALAEDPHAYRIALVGGDAFQFVLVPMRAPVVVGWVLMGFPLNHKLLEDMRGLSDVQLALFGRPPGQPPRVLATTLGPAALQALQQAGGQPTELPVAGDVLLARPVELDTSADTAVYTVLLRSVNEVMAPFHQAQVALAWITALGVLLFGAGSVVTARRVTTPLRALVAAAGELGRGRYDQPLQHTERRDEIGGLARAFDTMRVDIAAQQAEVRRLAYWDRQTGLPNRARFREAVEQEIARRSAEANPRSLSVLMLDLDRFKHVNDVMGYAFGDQLLVAVARRLGQHGLRNGDMVARLGGDEFAMLLVDSDAGIAQAVARRIAKGFEQPLALGEQTVDISAGLGIACWPDHAADTDTLLSRAEVAMYAAKAKTTVVQLYDAALDAGSVQTLSLLSELRRAVEHNELRLFMQPKLRLEDSTVVAAEALVRWQHPERGLVPPLDFIPFAEQTGFVSQLTLWVFDAAADLLAQIGPGTLRIAVNLSTRDLLDVEFPARLDTILERHGVLATGFCLEITESAIMDDPQRAQAVLQRLSDRGFKLSIDDFGTGYSSLAYLKRLPVDELKIDKSFVMNMEKDEDDAKIVRSTVDLAHNLGLTVVAEGVENALIWRQLRALNCDEGQGYFMSKPMPSADFLHWAQRWHQGQVLTHTGHGALLR
ncbi:bifunctional diguanylate cyclase/phosphodiesterase [Pseudorhodoferax sp. Leaf265]|uniref:putative bifunctional diguanylate cyclase/phosphodiesterase n=1 Tax=Pseudorhodoferax sp. Leaf265 TaxID=1736315 RepID=UPI0006F5CBB0|nr:EAL domain-containing protein [Pseudorhodoferax sp. Leaf265]KQP20316.1 diguanylate phosphodiesterase [Pseudorhodoferax sp. Leaf265]PZQ02901.1 MAG: GGDEF domain-containing protein [Variovorax paradoxus]PZQ16813.1 MAG: GGDEF domain-containing protein [Variovorax paradoxus]